ncbi:MAG: DNA repair protein RadA [Chloroflexi bacterium]|nr:DNA repair protein RadA [Chloroflexota bacterium]MXX82411.1 DNA repair protein RadA [Chloroflexota bacterium]MYA93466.1 DNA repair protein RadA [Chloroflexota bacterium]MYC56704.1 DNA repair protein RadA [Chloroflexota bacterium]MYE78290.1 DNA repair protein RadA [Chloroflexota bacterium]
MAKQRTTYICSQCGRRSAGYFKICPQCGEFNTFQEVVEQRSTASAASIAAPASQRQPQRLAEIDPSAEPRIQLPIAEFNRVLGGGLVPGSIILLGGEPGIGKSTLALQLSAAMAKSGDKALYVSGEESVRQLKRRADRLGLAAQSLYLLPETGLANIIAQTQELRPRLLVVDSIQTTRHADSNSLPGLPAQVRQCAGELQQLAKSSGISIMLVGHVTKDGSIAGPRVLEHIVDAVLYLEGDPFQHYRLLRGVKNRFGATSEIGVFEMRGSGLVEVHNPSEAFIEERLVTVSGSAIAITLEGTRPLLVEVQALTSPSPFSNPRRTANGFDSNRLLLLSAVLSKRLKLKLWEQDIFVNVIGGLKITEPAADLALALAIASSYHDRPLPADLAVVGEVGLGGELRQVGQLAARLSEAQKIGFKRALLPRLRRKTELSSGIELIEARNLAEALRAALPAV